jgi:phage/plasmid primase-like uncharacterized protein
MPRLLGELGFTVNTRTHRCRCILHDGRNPSSFSWRDDGTWYCFRGCGGGDRLALVMSARRCDFKTALAYVADLAGVNLKATSQYKKELRAARKEREKHDRVQRNVAERERQCFLAARSNVLALERLKCNASRRLRELVSKGIRGRELDLPLQAIALAFNELPRAAAAYLLASFADTATRITFAMVPGTRSKFISTCLEDGGVVDEKGFFHEMVL